MPAILLSTAGLAKRSILAQPTRTHGHDRIHQEQRERQMACRRDFCRRGAVSGGPFPCTSHASGSADNIAIDGELSDGELRITHGAGS